MDGVLYVAMGILCGGSRSQYTSFNVLNTAVTAKAEIHSPCCFSKPPPGLAQTVKLKRLIGVHRTRRCQNNQREAWPTSSLSGLRSRVQTTQACKSPASHRDGPRAPGPGRGHWQSPAAGLPVSLKLELRVSVTFASLRLELECHGARPGRSALTRTSMMRMRGAA